MAAHWDYPSPFIDEITVQPCHIDGLHHTNNAVYVQWCEEIAWKHSETLGLGLSEYQTLNRAMAINEAKYQYLAPSFADEKLTLGTWITKCDGRLTMERCFQFFRERDGKTLMRRQWNFTCINIETGHPARMPPLFLDCYISHIINR